MAWPIVINGHTYTEADFAGYNYQTAMPSAFNDVATRAADAETAASTATTKAGLTAADAVATAADRVQTGLDVTSAGASASIATTKAGEAAASAALAGSLVTGQLIYMGTWDASTTTYPATPIKGAFWKVSVAGTASGTTYAIGDDAIYNGATWDKIDNQVFAPTVYTFANRSNLRSGTPTANSQAVVESLGLFFFISGSTELDDDETCFAATGGRWELRAVDPDYVLGNAIREADTANRALDAFRNKFIWYPGSLYWGISGLAAQTSAEKTFIVPGAQMGDVAVVSPIPFPASGFTTVGASTADRANASVFAYVSGANQVTMTMRNAHPSTSAGTCQTDWYCVVIKK